jgi:hypothetical protein
MITSPLYPLSSQNQCYETTDIDGWKGEFRREGALPSLKFSPPLQTDDFPGNGTPRLGRGKKGVRYVKFVEFVLSFSREI